MCDVMSVWVSAYGVKVYWGVLVQTLGLAHGALDVQSLDILPVLLEQGNQEIDSQVDVVDQLIISHLHMANSNRQTQHLLHLELDRGFHLINFGHHVLIVC
ncbi:hypothetical protein STEG23_024417 [Scotinomys teguina]